MKKGLKIVTDSRELKAIRVGSNLLQLNSIEKIWHKISRVKSVLGLPIDAIVNRRAEVWIPELLYQLFRERDGISSCIGFVDCFSSTKIWVIQSDDAERFFWFAFLR